LCLLSHYLSYHPSKIDTPTLFNPARHLRPMLPTMDLSVNPDAVAAAGSPCRAGDGVINKEAAPASHEARGYAWTSRDDGCTMTVGEAGAEHDAAGAVAPTVGFVDARVAAVLSTNPTDVKHHQWRSSPPVKDDTAYVLRAPRVAQLHRAPWRLRPGSTPPFPGWVNSPVRGSLIGGGGGTFSQSLADSASLPGMMGTGVPFSQPAEPTNQLHHLGGVDSGGTVAYKRGDCQPIHAANQAAPTSAAGRDTTGTRPSSSTPGEAPACGAPAPRPRLKWTEGECVGALTAAASYWALSRGRRTGDKKRRTSQNLLNAFIESTPEQDRPRASMHSVEQLDKKLKALRASLFATRKEMGKTGIATQDKEDAVAAFEGQALYELAVSAFKDLSIFTEDTVREPVFLEEQPRASAPTSPTNCDEPDWSDEAGGTSSNESKKWRETRQSAAGGRRGAADGSVEADEDASDDLDTVADVRGGCMGRAGASVAVYTRRRRGRTPSGGSSPCGSTTGARRSGVGGHNGTVVSAGRAGGGAHNVVARSGGGIPAGEAGAAHETTRSGACAAPAPDTAAAAGAAASASVGSKGKRPRKETAASVLREYIQTKIDAEEQRSARDAVKRELDAETHTDSTVTENDLRRAMVNMFNAYAERARWQ